MTDLRTVIVVALGAGLGGAARYVVGQIFLQRYGPGFPYGTLFINVSGSFLIGIIAQLAATRALGVSPMVRLFAATGILGGYTTFSTFSLDSVTLLSESIVPTIVYALGSVSLGVIAAALGSAAVRIGYP